MSENNFNSSAASASSFTGPQAQSGSSQSLALASSIQTSNGSISNSRIHSSASFNSPQATISSTNSSNNPPNLNRSFIVLPKHIPKLTIPAPGILLAIKDYKCTPVNGMNPCNRHCAFACDQQGKTYCIQVNDINDTVDDYCYQMMTKAIDKDVCLEITRSNDIYVDFKEADPMYATNFGFPYGKATYEIRFLPRSGRNGRFPNFSVLPKLINKTDIRITSLPSTWKPTVSSTADEAVATSSSVDYLNSIFGDDDKETNQQHENLSSSFVLPPVSNHNV
jgi:hypothetical protein